MKKKIKWVFALGSFCALCAGFLSGVGSAEQEIKLYLTDALTFPSQPVQLQARLAKHGPGGDEGLPEEPVEFFLQGRLVGKAITDTNGWARLEFAPKMRGNLQLRAKWATTSKTEVVEGHGVLLSWERRRPIILIDLAVLVEEEPLTESPAPEFFPDSGLVLGKPSAAAPAELQKLAKYYYNLVYIDQTGKGRIEVIQNMASEAGVSSRNDSCPARN